MLDKNIIEENKLKFIELINSINRDGFDKEKLLAKLENSDFYTAPASSKFHNNFDGGLVDHSLNVYYNMCSMVKSKHLAIPEDTIKIVSLLHDLSKMNYYTKYTKNVKIYSENGKLSDSQGRFYWDSVETIGVKEESDRFVYGNHEENSEAMVRYFIPLTFEESAAILNHHGGVGNDSTGKAAQVFGRYNLATLLHLADMMSTYVDENALTKYNE